MSELAYAPAVHDLFERPPMPLHGGIRVRGGSPTRGVAVVWAGDAVGGVWQNVGFRAWGCPHIIALCHGLAERLDGAAVETKAEALEHWLETLSTELDIPAEKAVKILIIKDTLLELFASAGCSQPDGTAGGSG